MAGFGGSVRLTGASEYKKSLQQITQELKVVSAEMKATSTAFDSGDKSQKEVEKSAKEMQKALNEQKKALVELKNQLPQLNKEYETAKQKHDELSKELEKESKSLAQIKKTYGESSEEYKKQEKVVASLTKETNKAGKEEEKLGKSVNDARIQIANAESTINQTSKSLDTMGKEAEDSGKKAAKSSEGFTVMKGVLANLASTAITACISGLAKLGGAFINVGKDAIASYAEFEQLEGGVEKLFGADAAEAVKKNAQDAFKTAGLSANDYMETVTGFSASLIAGLDNDTVKAAEVADKAIKDMSDNANTFGTDISSIQNAYQGFAKGNYNMLDNLKLGYGGTKEEMLRLVKDAGVVNKSIKSIDEVSFDQIIEAIHLTQERMAISGTTAKEAATTIEGSTNAMKAAWQNLLTGMASGDADFEKLAQDFTDTLISPDGQGGVIGNLVPRISAVIGGMSTALGQLLPNLVAQVGPMILDNAPVIFQAINTTINKILNMLPDAVSGISDLIPLAISGLDKTLSSVAVAGVRIVVNLARGIAEGAPLLLKEIPVILSNLIEAVTEWAPDLTDAAIELMDSMATGLIEGAGSLLEQLPYIIGSIVSTISEELPRLLEAGKDIILKLKDGLIAGLPDFLQSLPQIISDTVNTLVSMLPEIVNTGTELINGLLDGLIEGIPILIENLPLIIETIITTLTDNLPLIVEAGVTLLVNLISGILSALPKLVSMVPKLISTLLTELTKALPKLLSMGGKILGELISGIGKAIPKLLQSAKEIVKTVIDALKSLPEKALEIGTNLVKGLWNGIKDAVGWIKDKIVEFGDSVLQGLKDFFGIESPSKVMKKEVGAYLAKGIGIGFTEEMKNVASQMQDSIPTSFDTNIQTNTAAGEVASNFDNMILAFKDALYQMRIELNGDNMGKFVDKTVNALMYA